MCHKYECFDAKTDSKMQSLSEMISGTATGQRPPGCPSREECQRHMLNALHGGPGIALYLSGKGGVHKIITSQGPAGPDPLSNYSSFYIGRPPVSLLNKAQDEAPMGSSGISLDVIRQCADFLGERVSHTADNRTCQQYLSHPYIRLATRALFEKKGKERQDTISFLQEVMKCVDFNFDPRCAFETPPSARSVQLEVSFSPDFTRCTFETPPSIQSVQGEVLHVGDVEIMYISPPSPLFASLTKSQMDFFNCHDSMGIETYQGTVLPRIRTPLVVYRCKKESWLLFRVNTAMHSIAPLDRMRQDFTAAETDGVSFKVFVIAAEINDIMALYGAWNPARSFAFGSRREDMFLKAAESLLEVFVKIHPHAAREEARMRIEMGETYESWASWLLKDKRTDEANDCLEKATEMYHRAALLTHQFYPNRCVRGRAYSCLGVALVRIEEYELAKRAFLWAMTDPRIWEDKSFQNDVCSELESLWDYLQEESDYSTKDARRSLRRQRQTIGVALASRSPYKLCCIGCNKTVTADRGSEICCGRCNGQYCSDKCRRNHWKEHKMTCKEQELIVDRPDFFNIGSCTETTQDLLNRVTLSQEECTVCLKEVNERIARWRSLYTHTPPPVPPLPEWMILELRRRTGV
jgi:hypothetical protein